MFEVRGKYNTAKIFATTIDDETLSQIVEICNQEWVKDSNIAIMPDCHAGKGCTIGTTMTIHDRVCPNLVGVDIGCGMLTVQLPKELIDISLEELDEFINNKIPSGFNINDECIYNPIHEGLYLNKLRCYDSLKNKEYLENSIGSLGGGNHFCEIDKDDEGNLYLVIHTGSRNLGKQVAEIYQDIAYHDCLKKVDDFEQTKINMIQELKDCGREKEIAVELEKFKKEYIVPKINKDLSYLEGKHMDDYLHDMNICQKFATVNRKIIAKRILEHLFKEKYKDMNGVVWVCDKECGYEDSNIDIRFECFETIHNYINLEDNTLRKGAISAKKGEIVLIPINMRDGAIIGIGKGNPDYNYSGPHGAGRLMSRSFAKENVSLDEFTASMEGIYSSSVGTSTLDESPMAYKPLDEILENIKESIDVVKIIKPIYNFKAH